MRVAVAKFPPTSAAAAAVRASTVGTLTEWSVNAEAVRAAGTIVDELAANAVAATRPGDEFVAVRLSASNGTVLIEVWSRTAPRQPDADDGTGHGSFLSALVGARSSVYRARSGGVVVWAQIPGYILLLPRMSPEAMPRRRPEAVDGPTAPLTSTVYSTDPEILARVADCLRALDSWHDAPTSQLSAHPRTTAAGAAASPGPGQRAAP
jgi:hypothetical protein